MPKIVFPDIPTDAVSGAATMLTPNDQFSVTFDHDTGIVRTVATGFWSLDATIAYFDDLQRVTQEVRARHGAIRVLVDRRGSVVQSQAVADMIRQASRDLYGAGDRVAIVVDSSLLKMQLRRLFVHETTKAFLSMDAAMTWLQAYAGLAR